MRKFTLFYLLGLYLFFLLTSSSHAAGTLTVNGSQTFQTIDGFGANVNTGWWNNGEVTPALDLLTDQLGATLFRACIEEMDWETVNDNADPNTFNWTYYNALYSNARFQGIWNTLQYLNQKGITNGLIISFMGKGPDWMGANTIIDTDKEDEFVETMASLLYYARNTKGIQFTLVSPLNETDTDGVEGPDMEPAQHARILRKLAVKLDAIGMSDVRFVAAEAAYDYNGFFNAIVADPVVMAKLAHWGVHQYGGDASGYQGPISSSAYPTKTFWVTECAEFRNMLGMLDDNATANLVWDGFDSIYQHAIRAGRGSTPPNDSPGIETPLIAYNATTHLYTPRIQFYQHAQLFKFVAPGARRIAATVANNGNLIAYAYLHPTTGRLTIVGRNTSASAISFTVNLTNLPATVTSLQLYRTNDSLNLARAADVAVSGGSFNLTLPANTYYTLVTAINAGTPPAVATPASANPSPVTSGTTTTLGVLGADDGGESALTYAWSVTAKPAGAPDPTYSANNSNAAKTTTATFYRAGAYSFRATISDAGGQTVTSDTSVNVAQVLGQPVLTPTDPALIHFGKQIFSAASSDQFGQPLPNQPTFLWSATGGSITSGGLFTAGRIAGNYTVTATAGSLVGQTGLTISAGSSGTVGSTGEGAFTDGLYDNGDYINATRVQASQTLAITLLRAKVGTISGKYRCAIYTDQSGVPGALLGATAEVSNPTEGWQDFPLPTTVTLNSGSNYWLAIWSNATTARVYATTGGALRWRQLAYGAWPSPLATTDGASTTYSIYGVAAAPSLFNLWKTSYGLATNLPPTNDDDHDGSSLFLEYALALDPTKASTTGLPAVSLLDQSQINFRFLRADPALQYIVQTSTELGVWTDLATNPGTVSPTDPVSVAVPADSFTRRFLRLKISSP